MKNLMLHIRYYCNAITSKFNNRRITVIKLDDRYAVEMRKMTTEHEAVFYTAHVHKKMLITSFELTEEALIALHEILGLALEKFSEVKK